MNRLKMIFSLVVVSACLLGTAHPVAAQDSKPAGTEPFYGLPLCQPGAYLVDPKDCVPLGPSATITDMAGKGITYPFVPILANKPDTALDKTDLKFARINVPPPERAPVYATLDDATSGKNPTQQLNPGKLIYVSYKSVSYFDSNPYVFLTSNTWMRASPLADNYSHFQGLEFTMTPESTLGWIVEQTKPRVAPGYKSAEITTPLPQQTSVQIYATQDNVDGTKWYQVGLNQWVERKYIRQLELSTTPPAGVDNNRWIDINLYEQTLAVYDQGQLVFATLIASGMKPYYTQPGLFKIYLKKATETMSGAFEADHSDYYYLEDVPWTMYFDNKRAIHGAYWRAMFGYEQSHGCINMSIGDSHWVFNWAKEGDSVFVHDPSGLTPTDPKFYGNGGA